MKSCFNFCYDYEFLAFCYDFEFLDFCYNFEFWSMSITFDFGFDLGYAGLLRIFVWIIGNVCFGFLYFGYLLGLLRIYVWIIKDICIIWGGSQRVTGWDGSFLHRVGAPRGPTSNGPGMGG